MLHWRTRRRPNTKALAQLSEAVREENRFRAEIGIDPVNARNVGLSESLDMDAPASERWLSRGPRGRGRITSIAAAGVSGAVVAAAIMSAANSRRGRA